jgi:DHA2 family multidrug resistance protein
MTTTEAAAARPKTEDGPAPFTGGTFALAIVVLALANFMAVLDINVVNVAIPYMAGSLGVTNNEGTWVITSYAIAEAIVVPLTGWLAGRFGTVRVFTTAVLGFGVCSVLCGLSISFPMLMVGRILQGLMGAPLMPASQTLLLRIAPPSQRNMAIGIWAMTTIAAPVVGPWVGGQIADTVGWQWLFLLNVPVAIACAILAWRMLAKRETEIVRAPIDFVGLGLLITWVSALQLMLDNGQDKDWFGSPFIIVCAVVAAIGFAAFIIWELTDRHPIVDLKVFRHRSFIVSTVTMFLSMGCFAGTLIVIPLWLQTNMGYTATSAGRMVALTGVLGVVMAPLAAGLLSKIDPRALISMGLAMCAGAILWRISFASNMTFAQLAIPEMAIGLGLPFFFVTITSLSMSSMGPDEIASASGLSNFIRTTATAFATSLITTYWTDEATRSRVGLVGTLNQPQTVTGTLQNGGFTQPQSLSVLNDLVQSQSVMLATNHVFLTLGLIFGASALGIWLAPKPAGPLAPLTEAH